MLNLYTELQPFKISFVHYALHPSLLNSFEALFCTHLDFNKHRLKNDLGYIYSHSAARYIVTLTEQVTSFSLVGIGIHLKVRKVENNSSDISHCIEQYAKAIAEKDSGTKFLLNPVLPLPALEVGKIVFYFTTNLSFQVESIFSKLNSCSTSSKNLSFYHHHVALYRQQNDGYLLEKFLRSQLHLEVKNFYAVPNSCQKFTAFQCNQVRLNIIESTEPEILGATSIEDKYSHTALGTNKISEFAQKVHEAAILPDSKIQVIPLGGKSLRAYYQAIKEKYSFLLTEEELQLIQRYWIAFDANLNKIGSYGKQFFFNTVLGLIEGIETRGDFQFNPQVGQAAYEGIQTVHPESEVD